MSTEQNNPPVLAAKLAAVILQVLAPLTPVIAYLLGW